MLNMCDRYTAEKFTFFQINRSSAEIASSLLACEARVGHHLKDGMIHRWFTDNELGFNGQDTAQ